MCIPYDIANYDVVSRQQPDHTAKTRSRGKNRITRDKSGTKRDLQEPNCDPGYGVIVQMLLLNLRLWLLYVDKFAHFFSYRLVPLPEVKKKDKMHLF